MEAEGKKVMWSWPGAKECGRLLEAGKGQDRIFPLEPPEETQPFWHLDFRIWTCNIVGP